MFKNFLSKLGFVPKIDPDELFALRWKFPDTIEVRIEKTESGYFARITNLSDQDNIVTQAHTGRELVEMVNSLVYDYLEIPSQYHSYYGVFLPPTKDRKRFELEIPAQYLNRNLSLVKG